MVVVVQVAGEVAAQAAVADLEVASEGGPPALFEDRAVQSFDVAVGLRSPGADLGVRNAGRESLIELSAAELVAGSSDATLRASAEVCSTVGPEGGQTTRSAQA